MSIKTVLFDLDGTLLPMDLNVFVKDYFTSMARKLAPHGYESEKLIASIWAGTQAMVKNDGSKTNEQVFWDTFCAFHGESARDHLYIFEEFYKLDFPKVQKSCGYDPRAARVVEKCKALGMRVALATNPIFPSAATKQRTAWAGLDINDFELVTTYENSRHCKPNLDYYRAVLEKLGADPTECLMVGNDVTEDMVAKELEMKVFLLTDCIINKEGADISVYPNGSFDELCEFITQCNVQR